MTEETEITPKPEEVTNIHQAIVAIMEQVGYVKKQRGQNLNYTYAGEAALIAAIRPWMVYYGVYCYVLETDELTREPYTTKSGSSMTNTVLRMVMRFTHASSQTYIDVVSRGEGSDSGDKSQNKALTSAFKYIWRQTFAIETGDDPDKDPSEQFERASGRTTAARSSGNGARPVAQAATKVELNDPKSIALASKASSKALVDFALAKGITSDRKEALSLLGTVLAGLPLPVEEAHWAEYIERIDAYQK